MPRKLHIFHNSSRTASHPARFNMRQNRQTKSATQTAGPTSRIDEHSGTKRLSADKRKTATSQTSRHAYLFRQHVILLSHGARHRPYSCAMNRRKSGEFLGRYVMAINMFYLGGRTSTRDRCFSRKHLRVHMPMNSTTSRAGPLTKNEWPRKHLARVYTMQRHLRTLIC